MAGMRDILIHAYENTDEKEIWKTIKEVMPNLLLNIKNIS